MSKRDKILELLEKKNPTAKDKQEIEELIGNDDELKEFAASYYDLSVIVSHSSHLSEEEIAEYILHQNGMNPDNTSITGKIPFIETHLRKCSVCSEIYKELNLEYSDADSFISETIQQNSKPISGTKNIKPENSYSRYRTSRYAFASVLVIGLVYLVLYIFSSLSTPAYLEAAGLNNVTEFSINRGRATENFQNSLKALEKDNYNEAIDYLQKDIKQNPDDETIFYSYYMLGLSYLETAGHSFAGLFPGYDQDRALTGANYLKESVRKNNSGKFTNIKLNAYFYLAKASLMVNDKKSAKEYLSMVINEKGSKMEEAKKLLGELE